MRRCKEVVAKDKSFKRRSNYFVKYGWISAIALAQLFNSEVRSPDENSWYRIAIVLSKLFGTKVRSP